jgi:hypothetical protein
MGLGKICVIRLKNKRMGMICSEEGHGACPATRLWPARLTNHETLRDDAEFLLHQSSQFLQFPCRLHHLTSKATALLHASCGHRDKVKDVH